MTSTLNPTAASAREDARRSDGKFGPQHHSESSVSLVSEPSEDFAAPAAQWNTVDTKERAKVMLDDLSAAIEQVVADGKLAAWMDTMRSDGLNRWSFRNRALAMMQLAQKCLEEGKPFPPPSNEVHMMGFKQWKAQGRTVKKGSKAIYILAPVQVTKKDPQTKKPEVDENGNPIKFTFFKSIPVFNVTDTDGEPLPEAPMTPPTGQIRPGVLTGLRDRVAAAGYTYKEDWIAEDPEAGVGTLGYTTAASDPRGNMVVIDHRLSAAQKASTLAHELAHIKCEHVKDIDEYQKHRGQMETEAEMTAYLVNRELGMEAEDANSFSPGYIAGWSKGDTKTITKAMDKAVKAYQQIVDGDWPEADSDQISREPVTA